MVAGAEEWNKLPLELKGASTVETFKTKLKNTFVQAEFYIIYKTLTRNYLLYFVMMNTYCDAYFMFTVIIMLTVIFVLCV